MSAKTCATPCSASHSCISRSPGVSISNAPPGKTNSSREVVVCRPRLWLSRTGRTSCTVCPSSRFAIVDFPTPDDPSNTNVCPGLKTSSSSPKPSPVFALTTHTAVPTVTRSISAALAHASSQVSALFKTITGFAPDSQHCARYRSTRRGLKSSSNADTSSAVSTFAAITCSSILFPGDLRTNLLRLAKTSCITAVVLGSCSSAATQSPTAGQSAPSSAARRSFPLASAQLSPKSPATRQNFRCCAITRAGTAFFQSSPCQNASKYEFHPQPISDPAVDTDKSSRSHRQHTAAVRAKSKQRCSDGLELREGCCGQFLPAAETHPPARTLLMVRTVASVAELANAALPHSIALNQILATRPVRVNTQTI